MGHVQAHLFLGGAPAVHDAGHLAAAEHQDPVAQLQQHVQILAHQDHGHALQLLLVEQAVDGVGGVDVQAPDGIGGHEHRGGGVDLPAHQHLLHVAAGQPPHRRGHAGGDDLQLLNEPLGQGPGGLPVYKGALVLPVGLEHHVVHHVHARHQAHAQPVFGHEGQGHAHLADLGGVLAHQLLPVSVHRHVVAGDVAVGVGRVVEHAARLHMLQAGDGLQQLLLPRAGDARDAQDLAAEGLEGHVVQGLDPLVIPAGQALHLQPQILIFGLRPVDVQAHRPAHHHLGEGLGVCLGGVDGADVPALAQHRHLVGQGHDLVELVGDDDDGLAVGAHVAQYGEELLRLLGGEDGGGLVQDQDVRPTEEHLDDLHRLLLRHGHVVDLLVRVDVEAVFLADLLHPAAGGADVKPPLPLQAQDDVLRRGEHVHQLEVLVDHADAQGVGVLGGADGDLLPLHEDVPLVGEVDAGDHVHQGGLAAAVLPQQGEDLPPLHVQIDVVIGHHAAEALGDPLELDCTGTFQAQPPFPAPGGRSSLVSLTTA